MIRSIEKCIGGHQKTDKKFKMTYEEEQTINEERKHFMWCVWSFAKYEKDCNEGLELWYRWKSKQLLKTAELAYKFLYRGIMNKNAFEKSLPYEVTSTFGQNFQFNLETRFVELTDKEKEVYEMFNVSEWYHKGFMHTRNCTK